MTITFFTSPRIIAIGLFILLIPVFYYFATISHLDMYGHCLHIQAFVDTGIWRPNVAYYLLVWILAGFSTVFFHLQLSTAVVLAFFVAWKFRMSLYLTVNRIGLNQHSWLTFSMLMLCFVFSIPVWYNNWFFGQIPPNHWHNSTTIMLFPFALLLFWESYQYLKQPTNKKVMLIILLTLLNVMVKPSFFFCVAMVFPLFLISRFNFGKAFWQGILPVFIGTIGVGAQYYYLYASGPEAAELLSGEGGGVKVAPFHIWSYYSYNIPISILASFPIPIYFFILYHKKLKKELLFNFAIALLFAAVAIFIFLSETGRREFHNNFMWQAIVASYILHWVCLCLFYKWKQFPKRFLLLSKSEKSLVYLFFFQTIVGLLYVLRMLLRNGSYA